MPKKKLFSDWLIKKYGLKVRDLSQTEMPWFWRKFTTVGAIGIKKKYIYIRNLKGMSETSLVRRILHELRHLLRQRKIGWTVFLIRYGTSKKFRAMEEVNAYTRTLEARLLFGSTDPGPGHYAKLIRDSYYVGKKQYKRARQKLYINYAAIGKGKIRIVKDLWEEYQFETNKS